MEHSERGKSNEWKLNENWLTAGDLCRSPTGFSSGKRFTGRAPVRTLVVAAREDLEIARLTREALRLG